MIAWVKKWIDQSLSRETFASRQGVLLFAINMSLSITLLANCLTTGAHVLFHKFGLLPYDLLPVLLVGLVITTVLASLITFTVAYVVGLAIHELWVERDGFEHLSRVDTLSGLLNRRAFLEAFETAPDDTTLVIFDVDRFKSVNDTYGHEVGDRVITHVAATLSAIFGDGHIVSRIGGEEFAVLIVGLDSAKRQAKAERALATIKSTALDLGTSSVRVTLSAGMAERRDYEGFNALFAAADKALYVAKASGRNRLVQAGQLTEMLFATGSPEALRRA